MKQLQIILLSFCMTPLPSIAALVDLDWESSIGADTLLMLDTSTGLEWLDLSVTANQSYNQVMALTGSGEVYQGLRFATRDEVLSLWQQAGITDSNYTWVDIGEYELVKDLADRLGTSVLFDGTGVGTHALGMVENGGVLADNERRVMELTYHYDGVQTRTSSNYYTLDVDYASIHYSSYLVRPSAIPIPASLWLFVSGILSIWGYSRAAVR